MIRYLIARLQEPSTWRGLVLIATAFGSVISPDQVEAIVIGGLFLAGLLGAIVPDSQSGTPPASRKHNPIR